MSHQQISVLQIGTDNWELSQSLSERFDWHYLHPNAFQAYLATFLDHKAAITEGNRQMALLKEHSELSESDKATYIKAIKDQLPKLPQLAAVVLSDRDYEVDLSGLKDLVNPYQVFAPQEANFSQPALQALARQHFFQSYALEDLDAFVYRLSKILFPGQYGSKFHVGEFQVSQDFSGRVSYEGHSHLVLEGEFGDDYSFLGSYGYNLPYDARSCQDLWPEFIKDETIALRYRVTLIQEGSLANVIGVWDYDGTALEQPFLIDHSDSGYLSVSLFAKGSGLLKLGPFHYRYSRAGYGDFVLGGKRYVDSQRREFHYFFDPQDFKPPLVVYFSGWRAAEGFEGYGMMKQLGCPFLLICDPRLTGGAFYMGTPEFEAAIVTVIQNCLDFLGFTSRQLILSGLSMGTYGALYYGCDLSPASVIISKPVLSNGRMALWERLDRPGVFPVSLDLLLTHNGQMTLEGAAALDARFWDKFQQADWSATSLMVAYMKQDDYDTTAFDDLVHQSKDKRLKIIGRGWEGRHNDGNTETISWFIKQHYQVLSEHFGRERDG